MTIVEGLDIDGRVQHTLKMCLTLCQGPDTVPTWRPVAATLEPHTFTVHPTGVPGEPDYKNSPSPQNICKEDKVDSRTLTISPENLWFTVPQPESALLLLNPRFNQDTILVRLHHVSASLRSCASSFAFSPLFLKGITFRHHSSVHIFFIHATSSKSTPYCTQPNPTNPKLSVMCWHKSGSSLWLCAILRLNDWSGSSNTEKNIPLKMVTYKNRTKKISNKKAASVQINELKDL